jgi:light-regulated signal transduction histidine kinase (bacteriophytochrome)|tara:strand:+ start:320 stop:550 length:231 start_codon:yes stop_codon:yes gene_type:complete
MNNKEENRHEKFKRIASHRTKNALKSLRSLAKLSNTRNYQYTKSEVNKIFSVINNELRVTKAMFDKYHLKEEDFKL